MRGSGMIGMALLASCGYHPSAVTEPPIGDAADDAVDSVPGEATIDGFVGPLATPCVQKWLSGTVALTTPTRLNTVATNFDERDPFLSVDETIIYYSSPNVTDTDILFATRTAITDSFGSSFVKTSLSDPSANDGKVTMTGDELTAYIATEQSGGAGGFDLWQATRSSAGTQAFASPLTKTVFTTIDDAGNQLDPHISSDGLRLYYAAGSPQQVLFSSRADTAATFSAGVVIGNVGSTSGDADPVLSGDERVLLLTSNRPGLGGTDIYYATRAERDQPFGPATMVPTVNGTSSDGDAHLTADGCHLYFASNRAVDFDIYFSTVQ